MKPTNSLDRFCHIGLQAEAGFSHERFLVIAPPEKVNYRHECFSPLAPSHLAKYYRIGRVGVHKGYQVLHLISSNLSISRIVSLCFFAFTFSRITDRAIPPQAAKKGQTSCLFISVSIPHKQLCCPFLAGVSWHPTLGSRPPVSRWSASRTWSNVLW